MQDKISKEIVKKRYLQTLEYLDQERMRKFVGIALTLIALSFFGLFAINPTVSTILRLRKELEDSKYVNTQLETKNENLNKLRTAYTNIEKDLNTINEAISVKPNAHLLFAQIQAISQQNNIKLSKLQNFEVEVIKNNKSSGKKYYSFSFSLGGNGTAENIYKFVAALSQMQRIISIDVFSLSGANISGAQEVGFAIQGTAFFMEENI